METIAEADALRRLQTDRGLRAETIARFGIKLWTDHEGTQFYRYRCSDWPDGPERLKRVNGSKPKYKWLGTYTKGPYDVYGLSAAREIDANNLLLVEGEPDVWVCQQAGLPAVSFTHGANSPPDQGLRTLAGTGARITVIYDVDTAGQQGTHRVASALRELGSDATVRRLPDDKPEKYDLTDLYKDCGFDDQQFRDTVDGLHEAAAADLTDHEAESGPLAGLCVIEDQSAKYDAHRFVTLHGDKARWVRGPNKWLIYCPEHQRWRFDDSNVLVNGLAMDLGPQMRRELQRHVLTQGNEKAISEAIRYIRNKVESSQGIAGFVHLARSFKEVQIELDELDPDPWLLGVKNGVVDLRSGTLRAGQPTDFITKQCSVPFIHDAEAPRFTQCMEDWHPDPAIRKYVQRMAGHMLIGAQREHAFFILYGGGRNGKGTFVRAIQNVLGEYARVIDHSLLVKGKKQEHATVKAALRGALLAVASETDSGAKLDEASIKNLTGGDVISARGMHEDPYEFTPRFSLWIQTNHLPAFSGPDRGIKARTKVVPFTQSFEGEKGDPGLDEALRAEATGILRWVVEGCLDYLRVGLSEPEGIRAATLRYQESQNHVGHFINDAALWFNDAVSIQTAVLNAAADKWCRENGVEFQPFVRELNKHLAEERGLRKESRRPERIATWYGVGVKS